MSDVRALPVRAARSLGVVALCAAITLLVLGFVFAGTSAVSEFGIPVAHRPLESWEPLALVVDWTGEPAGPWPYSPYSPHSSSWTIDRVADRYYLQ